MVLCDGLGDTHARERMGFMEHLVEEHLATRYTSRAVLPTMSRPNYESLHTGVPPHRHGKTSNYVVGKSTMPNVFSAATGAGLQTAAVAYHWFSELYHRAPFDPVEDSEYDHADGGITFGRFYRSEEQPDGEIIVRGELLAQRFRPDYLLVHPMAIDHAGHEHGQASQEYRRAIGHLDELLATAIPRWLGLGYTVIVTADHGHDDHRHHGGTEDKVRNVPLYVVPAGGNGTGAAGEMVSHLQVAPTVLELLGVPAPSTMETGPLGHYVPTT